MLDSLELELMNIAGWAVMAMHLSH